MRHALAGVLCALSFVCAAEAATLTWTGAVSDRWSVAGNWSPAAVPANGDALVFPPPASTINDLDPSLVLDSVSFAAPATVSGTTVQVSRAVLVGPAATLPLRAMASGIWVTGGTLGGSLDVNGYFIEFQLSVLAAAVSGSGRFHTFGRVALTGTSTFSGTFECGGYCTVDGDWSAATFLAWGTISGSGTIGTYAGIGPLIPGSPLTIKRMTAPPAEWHFKVTNATTYTRVVILDGGVFARGPLVVEYDPCHDPAVGETYKFIDNRSAEAVTGGLTDEAGVLAEGNATASLPWEHHFSRFPGPSCTDVYFGAPVPVYVTYPLRVSYAAGDGNDVSVTRIDPADVPTSLTITQVDIAPWLLSHTGTCSPQEWNWLSCYPLFPVRTSVSAHVRVTRADGRPAFGFVHPVDAVAPFCCVPHVLTLPIHGGEAIVPVAVETRGWTQAIAVYEGPFGSSYDLRPQFIPPETVTFTTSTSPAKPHAYEPVTVTITRRSNFGGSIPGFELENPTLRVPPNAPPLKSTWIEQPGSGLHDATQTASFLTALPASYPPANLHCWRCVMYGPSDALLTVGPVDYDDTSTTLATPTFSGGQPSTVGVTVAAAHSTYGPNGTVTLREGTTVLATAPLTGGKATLTGPPLPLGEHALTVEYSGEWGMNASSAALMYRVEKTAVALAINGEYPTTMYGHPALFTVTTTPPVSTTLALSDGRAPLGTVLVTNGRGTFTTDSLPAGPHILSVRCGETSDCEGAAAGVAHEIEKSMVVLRAFTVDRATAAGKPVAIDAAVALSTGKTATGTIDVEENGTRLGSAALEDGRAIVSAGPLPTGEHLLSVRYSGDRNCLGDTTTLAHTVLGPVVSADSLAVAEGNRRHAVSATLRLSAPSPQSLTVEWSTADGTAAAGRDYERGSGTVTFAPGETERTIQLTILGNTIPEHDKTFALVLPEASGLVHIVNDDPFYERHDGLPYGPEPEQTLDLLVPVDRGGPFPLVVSVAGECNPSPHEAERGYAVAILSAGSARIDDLAAALQWLRDHANEYQIDAQRTALWGIGPTGHLAAFFGTSRDGTARVQAVVDWFGENDRDAVDAAAFASADDPPFLIMHGAADDVVPVWNSQTLFLALRNAGVDAAFHIVDAVGHGGEAWEEEGVLDVVDRYLDEKLTRR